MIPDIPRTLSALGLLGLALLFCGELHAQNTGTSAKIQRENKGNPALVEVKDDPALPRVLLIGDSISIGYTVPTRRLLEGKANVHRIPTNGGPTTRGLEHIGPDRGRGLMTLRSK